MSSVTRNPSQVPTNKLYINIGAVQSSIVDTNLSTVAWVTQVGALSTAGRCLFRDMGKTVYLPDPTVGNASIGAQSSILRKVQLIPSGAQGSYGTGGVAGVVGTEFFTGYVRLGGQTYAGGTGVPTAIARIN
jgi:hypothetical protein